MHLPTRVPTGLRSDTSIVVDTLSCYTTHHAATLIGYGAHAICPHLAYETARQWRLSSRTQSLVKAGKVRARAHERSRQPTCACCQE